MSSLKKVAMLSSLAFCFGLTSCDNCKNWSVEKDKEMVDEAVSLLKNKQQNPENVKKARKLLESALKCRRKNADDPEQKTKKYYTEYNLYFQLGRLLSWDDETRAEGIEYLREARNVNPNDPDVSLALANALMWEGVAKKDMKRLTESRDIFYTLNPSNTTVQKGTKDVEMAIQNLEVEQSSSY